MYSSYTSNGQWGGWTKCIQMSAEGGAMVSVTGQDGNNFIIIGEVCWLVLLVVDGKYDFRWRRLMYRCDPAKCKWRALRHTCLLLLSVLGGMPASHQGMQARLFFVVDI